MNLLSHHSAKPSHYNKSAKHYDQYNEENSKLINRLIEKILNKHKVKTVLDLTCGTGSQVFWLAKQGFEITGYDINAKILKIAKEKAVNEKLTVKFAKGDMRTTCAGQFDAVITIFNAVGHLKKSDFETTIRNIHKNLNDGGIYLFDIFNLNYLLKDNNITKLTIDWQKIVGDTKIRETQYSTIDGAGILASYTINHEQRKTCQPNISKSFQTLQVYTAKQLKEMLQKNRFKVLRQCNIDGSRFSEFKSERIFTIAKKLT